MDWYLTTIRKAIDKGPHTFTLTTTAIDFCQKEIFEPSLWGFIIVLTLEDVICLFGALLCISCITLVEQHSRKIEANMQLQKGTGCSQPGS